MKWLIGFCAAPFGGLAIWALWSWIQYGHSAPWPEGSVSFLFLMMGLVMALVLSGSYSLQRIALSLVAASTVTLLLAVLIPRGFSDRYALVGVSIFLALVFWYAFHEPEEGSYIVSGAQEAELRFTVQGLSVIMMPILCFALFMTLPVFLMNVGTLSTTIIAWGMLNLTGPIDDFLRNWEKMHHIPRELVGSLITTLLLLAFVSRERLLLAADTSPGQSAKEIRAKEQAKEKERVHWRRGGL